MRSPRVVYGVVAAILAVAGFVLPRYLADRSAPELGETVVISPGASVTPSTTPSAGSTEPGADPVSPGQPRTAGDDDRDDPDDLDDRDDDG